MKVVLDTNVFVSGVFFRGPPYQVLKSCGFRMGIPSNLVRFKRCLSPLIIQHASPARAHSRNLSSDGSASITEGRVGGITISEQFLSERPENRPEPANRFREIERTVQSSPGGILPGLPERQEFESCRHAKTSEPDTVAP